jgi:hypothetical protein
MTQAYTGRQVPLNVAVSEAQAVVVGELLKSGNVEMGGPGQAYYDGARIRVVEALSGEVKPELTIAYTCQKIPEQSAEAEPQEGELYLFFLTLRNDGTWRANKIDVASPSNKATVKKLIEGSPPARSIKP